MTALLYNDDCYTKDFSAVVISCTETVFNKQKAYDIVLSATCFFPEQGGQDSDTGKLFILDPKSFSFGPEISFENADNISLTEIQDNSIPINVLHTSIKDNTVHHICDNPIEPDNTVWGFIDWEKRYDRMQQHSGEHLVSGTVNRLFGYDNVGFHLSDREVTLDFNGTFTEEDILRIEDIVNNAIYENIETIISYPSSEELKSISYRSKKELEGQVRIVEFPGYDICACCAPHVLRTGEIGMIKIVASEHFRQGTRMWIKCGKRALDYYRMLLSDARIISQATSSKIEDISNVVLKQCESLKTLRYTNILLEKKVLSTVVDEVISDKNPVFFLDSADADNIREAVNRIIAANSGLCGAFTGSDENGYRYIIASSSINCRDILNDLKALFNIKGGGSPEMIQGTIIAQKEEIEEFWKKK